MKPRIPIPARERAARDDHENFYWLQEDYLRAKAADQGFTWTISMCSPIALGDGASTSQGSQGASRTTMS